MKPKNLVRLSNIIGVISTVCLVYWVFISIVSSVFDFKVFQEHITEIFLMSIFGILSLMAGALMINIMFNRFNNKDSKFELFYPHESDGKIIIFYFFNYLRYAMLGS